MEFVACDLADLDAVRVFCASWTRPISALLLNAGVQSATFSTVGSGIERTFAINHLGHAALFFGLQSHLTPEARIIIVSSELHNSDSRSRVSKPHWTSAAEVARPTDPEMQGGMTTYANSKLANMLFALALAARTMDGLGAKWAVIAMTPGFVPAGGSYLYRDRGSLGWVAMTAVRIVMNAAWYLGYSVANISTVARSGKAMAELVTGAEHEGEKGSYYQIEVKAPSSAQSHDKALQNDLWEWTVKELGIDSTL